MAHVDCRFDKYLLRSVITASEWIVLVELAGQLLVMRFVFITITEVH